MNDPTLSEVLPSSPESALQILDSRTGSVYTVPIHKGNFIKAADLGKIKISDAVLGVDDNDSAERPILRSLNILDKGFEYTACMTSRITLVDGERGIIRYRDIPIEQLFSDYIYEDVMHLLIWGQLPTLEQKIHFRRSMARAAAPPQIVVDVISAFPKSAEIFPMLIASLSAFTAADDLACQSHHQAKPMFQGNLPIADQMIARTIAYYASSIALIHCHKNNIRFTPPEEDRSLIGNLLLMMGINKPEVEECFNKLWILYADHEITNSTAALLHAGSSLADPISAVISGIASSFGPLHGGAISLAYEIFDKIGSPEAVPEFIANLKSSKTRLFGYEHRVYKARDPRLGLIEKLMYQHREAVDANPLLRIAMAIEQAADSDSYFKDRGLKANADLKGCILYTAMGFDTEMFIAIVGLSRLPGALAHWRETLVQPVKLWRPQQIYQRPAAYDEKSRMSTGLGSHLIFMMRTQIS